MAFIITSACLDVKDMSCIEVCPVDCIHHEDDDRMCFIDPDVCIDCAVCVSACPVGAIFDEPDTPSDQKAFIEVNALWFKDKDAARSLADKSQTTDL